MDRADNPEQGLLAQAVNAMEPLGLQIRVLRLETPNGDHRVDATIGLRFGGRRRLGPWSTSFGLAQVTRFSWRTM